jgi:hypothetical protein
MHAYVVLRRALVATVAALCMPAAANAQTIGDHIAAFADIRNGGITSEEADQLRAEAASYPLEIHFARRMAEGEAFAADVQVTVFDQHGGTVLALPAADPILLARLAPGRYTVVATYEGRTKRQQVTVGHGHQKIGFLW